MLGRLKWRFLSPVALVAVALAVWAQTNTPPTLTGADPVSVRPDRSATVTLSATDVDSDPDDPTQSEPVMIQTTAPTGAPAWLDDTGWSVSAQPNPQLSFTVSPPSDAQPAQYTVTALATDSRGLSATSQFSVGVLAPLCTAALEVDDGTGTCVACTDHHVPNQSKTACVACAEDTERPSGTASCTACAAGSSSPGGSACVANQAPTAHAGADQSVETGATVTLTGASSDPDGDALTYAWAQTSGTAVALSSATAQSPTFTAPSVADTLTFTLTVTDSAGNSASDTVTVMVSPPALSVSLSASSPSVCDGDLVSLVWNSTGADALTLAPPVSCPVTANGVGICEVTLNGATTWTATATAGTETQTDSATVSVLPPSKPYAPTNSRQTGGTADSVAIAWDAPSYSGACSTKVEYRVVRYTSLGCSSADKVQHTNVGSATTHTATGLTSGTHWFKVRARNDVASGWRTGACFSADTAANAAPTADAGADQTVAAGATVTLAGAGTDPDGDALTYAWTQTAGATVALSSATAQSPTFTAPSTAGTLTFTLTVTDSVGNSASDTVTVTVSPPALSVSLSAQPASVCSGTPSTLSWASTGAATLSLSPPVSCAVTAGTDGTCPVSPTSETTWTATATAGTQTETATATVSITPPTKPSAPRNAARTGGTASSVTIAWDAPLDAGTCSTTVRYRVVRYTGLACNNLVKASSTNVETSTTHTETGLSPGTHWFRIRARNDEVSGSTSTGCFPVDVVANAAPTADAGADQSVETGATVTLTGGGTDPDGDALTYAWAQTSGTAVALSSATAQSPTFTAPAAADTLTFTLTVTDSAGNPASDTVTVTVSPPALSVSLMAQPASVCSGTPSALSWTSTGATTLSLSPPVSCAVTAGTDGTCPVSPTSDTTWTATATAGTQTETATATVSITPPTKPSAPRNAARTGGTASSVTIAWDAPLDAGTCSTTVRYRVVRYTGLACNNLVKASSTNVETSTTHTETGLSPGTHWFRIRARNDEVSGSTSTACFPVDVVANAAPTADAGADQTVAADAMVTLTGGGTDPDGDALTYAWAQTSGTAVALSSATAQSPTFTAPSAADTLTFTLTVTDSAGNSASDTVTVTVSPPALSVSLSASSPSVCDGDLVSLVWNSTGADALTLAPPVSCPVTANGVGFCEVTLNGATTWTATATAGTETQTDSATVSVLPPSKPYAPTNSRQTGGTADSVAIAWDAPSYSGACSTKVEYRVVRYTSLGCSSADKVQHTNVGSATTHTATGLTSGTHWFKVRARNDVASGSRSGPCFSADTVANAAPTADAGADQTVAAGATVTLTGGGTDPDGDALTYAWAQTSGTAVALSSATAQSPTFTAPSTAGTLTFTLTVTDSAGSPASDTVAVTVAALPQATLALAASSIAENGGNTTVSASLDLAATSAFTVTITTDSDAVTLGDNAQLSVAVGSTTSTGTVTLLAVDDTLHTGDRTVMVSGALSQGAQAIAPADVALTVTDDDANTTPDFGALTIADHNWPKDVGIAPLTLPAATGGNGALAYSLSPGLPAGLNFDATTRTVSGTPTASQALTLYTYTATDADGSTASLTFNLVVGYWRLIVSPVPTNGAVSGTVGAETVIDCGTDCTSTLADGATVALTATAASGYDFSAWGGACAGTTGAACSLSLDGDKTVSATFAPAAVDGVCNEAVVDGCAAGTLNTTVFNDDDSHHNWRCDGINGGANSPMCSKLKAACPAHTPVWTVGANDCRAPVTGANSGETRTATDNSGTYTGTATYKCDDGTWLEQPGSTCDQ